MVANAVPTVLFVQVEDLGNNMFLLSCISFEKSEKVFSKCIRTVLLHDNETWTVTKENSRREWKIIYYNLVQILAF